MNPTTKTWTMLLAGPRSPRLPMLAPAQEGAGPRPRATARVLRKALQGKTVAYVPVALNFDLTDDWGRVCSRKPMARHEIHRARSEQHHRRRAGGHHADLRKAGRDDRPQSRRQTYASCCSAPRTKASTSSRSTWARPSSTAFVGANWIEIGEKDDRGVVKACAPAGKSNKIADRAGRAVGGGQRLHAQGRRERARQAPRHQGRLQPGRRLGRRQGQGDHRRPC